MSAAGGRPERVRMPYVEQLAERLSPRDWSIIFSVNRVRLLTGSQLERLHFHELTGRGRSVKRGQVLRRLVDAGVLIPLERLVGTANRGSAKQRYALDAAGRQLVRLRVGDPLDKARIRRPRIPSDRLTKHTLAVSELYVQLVEAARSGDFTIREFQVEADAYWPDGQGGWIKPDAFVWLERPGLANYWWYEADMPRHESDTATEDTPTIRDKLLDYLDFVNRGQLGPDEVVPRPLFGVPTGRRRTAIQSLIEELPAPADALFRVAEMVDAAQVMVEEIMKKKEGFADV